MTLTPSALLVQRTDALDAALAERDNLLQHLRWTLEVLDDGDSNAPLVELARRMKKGRDAALAERYQLRAEVATWQAAHAERSKKVKELQEEVDAWIKVTDAHTRRGDEYLSRATVAERERDDARARLEAVTRALRGIQQMVAEDLRTGEHGMLWQIEADARAALAAQPLATGDAALTGER